MMDDSFDLIGLTAKGGHMIHEQAAIFFLIGT